MAEKKTSSAAVRKEKSRGRTVPLEAEQEIIDRLFRDAQANANEMADVLKRYGVCGDPEALQHAWRKSQVQRIMSRFRDEEGKRQVLAGKGGTYHVIPLCNDLEALEDISQRLQHQYAGLNESSDVVTRRTIVVRCMLDGLKASYRKRMANREESTS